MGVGLFGGTFDPVHTGHLIAAQEAKHILSLQDFFFVPTGQPWLKTGRKLTDAYHRLNMLRIALSGSNEFKISLCEIERKGPTYTVDTIREFRRDYGEEEPIYFIAGLDAFKELHLWKSPAELIRLCRIVAVSRPGYSGIDLSELEQKLPGVTGRCRILQVPEIGISSSDIRKRVKDGKPIKYLVPPGVEIYIEEHRLYI